MKHPIYRQNVRKQTHVWTAQPPSVNGVIQSSFLKYIILDWIKFITIEISLIWHIMYDLIIWSGDGVFAF